MYWPEWPKLDMLISAHATRRKFLQHVATSGVCLAYGLRPALALASTPVFAGKTLAQVAKALGAKSVAPSADEVRDDDFASVPDPSPLFDAPPATGAGPFPLIVFGHGLGGVPAVYGDLLESWAAAGFVVAGFAFGAAATGAA